jgi:hypothetical protein
MVTDNKALRVYFYRRLISTNWVDGKLIYIMKNGTDLGKAMEVIDEILTSDATSLPAGGMLIYQDGTQSVSIPVYGVQTKLKLNSKEKFEIKKAIEDFKMYWEDPAMLAELTLARVITFELLSNSAPDDVVEAISLYLVDKSLPVEDLTINFTMKGGGFLGKIKFGV